MLHGRDQILSPLSNLSWAGPHLVSSKAEIPDHPEQTSLVTFIILESQLRITYLFLLWGCELGQGNCEVFKNFSSLLVHN